jgi:hypothetical protein
MIESLVVVGIVVLVGLVAGAIAILRHCPNPLDFMDTDRL